MGKNAVGATDGRDAADAAQARIAELEAELAAAKAEVVAQHRRPRLGLVWEDQREAVEDAMLEQLPVLVAVPARAVGADDAARPHLLIEGDNLHALASLQYTHAAAVDVIYIDPPYNTGNEFRYNDRLVGDDDEWRHSKWLSFMHRRLRLAHGLLKDTGVIFISIDDHEQAHLKLLCDQVFGAGNFVATFVWQKKKKGSHLSKTVRQLTEYVLCYAKRKDKTLALSGPQAKAGQRQPLLNRPNAVGTLTFQVGTGIGAEDGRYGPCTFGSGDLKVELLDAVTVWQGKLTQPARFRGRFKWVQENLDRELAAGGDVKFSAPSGKSPGWKPTVLKADQDTKVLCPPSLLSKDWSPEVGTNEDGSAEIEALLGDISVFDYPKPTSLVQYLVRTVTASRPDAVVLDFFAGSGTTGHAVAVLNAADSGSRQAILVTNNENDICVKVTHARMKAVLTGDWANGPHDPLPGALRYYRCDFVPVSRNRDVMLRRLAGHASDLIAIRENTHTTIAAKKGQYTVLSGGGRTTVVWCNWNTEGLDDVLASHVTDDAALYLFSFSDNPDPDIVAEYPDWRVESLPEPIRAALQRAHRRSSAR